MRAWTRPEVGAPIRALAEFLPHEVQQIQAELAQYRRDETLPEFRPLPKGTNEDLAKLAAA